MVCCRTLVLAIFAGLFADSGDALAFELITREEAAYPPGILHTTRGPVPGPSIEVEAPPTDVDQTSPIHLVIRFRSYGGSNVDKNSVRLIYVKSPFVELTPRVQDFINADGIDLKQAEVPPGTHTIRIQLKDTDGRPSYTNFTFKVAR